MPAAAAEELLGLVTGLEEVADVRRLSDALSAA
jgi:hypothetical protein